MTEQEIYWALRCGCDECERGRALARFAASLGAPLRENEKPKKDPE